MPVFAAIAGYAPAFLFRRFIIGACPGIAGGRLPGAQGPDVRRRGAETQQMAPRRRTENGACGLQAVSVFLVSMIRLDIGFLLAP